VAIERTGVDGRAGVNMREGALEVILTSARAATGVTAPKTEGRDAQGLADVVRPGLLKPSFMPPRPLRELRELTR